MAVLLNRPLPQLRSTRDLRAEILSLAADLAGVREAKGRLNVTAPIISRATVQAEWDRLLPAIAPQIRARMTLSIEAADRPLPPRNFRYIPPPMLLGRPNYRFEVLRLLLGARLGNDGMPSINDLVETIGASQTPIRHALVALEQAGIVHSRGRGLAIEVEAISAELLARLHAQPQTVRFRFGRGTQIKPPAALLKRALALLRSPEPVGLWTAVALSGSPVAQADVPALDLIGVPRLDLLVQLPRTTKAFDTQSLRLLDDGLEPEPNVLAPAPVVVTLARADTAFVRDAGLDGARCAYPMDVFLSLIDMGLRDQAVQYAKAVQS